MLRHPYMRAAAALLGAWMLLVAAIGGASVAYRSGSDAGTNLVAAIVCGLFTLGGVMLAVNGITCAAYGTWRSLRRDNEPVGAGQANWHGPPAVPSLGKAEQHSEDVGDELIALVEVEDVETKITVRRPDGKQKVYTLRSPDPDKDIPRALKRLEDQGLSIVNVTRDSE